MANNRNTLTEHVLLEQHGLSLKILWQTSSQGEGVVWSANSQIKPFKIFIIYISINQWHRYQMVDNSFSSLSICKNLFSTEKNSIIYSKARSILVYQAGRGVCMVYSSDLQIKFSKNFTKNKKKINNNKINGRVNWPL